jgi:hypothetical protein
LIITLEQHDPLLLLHLITFEALLLPGDCDAADGNFCQSRATRAFSQVCAVIDNNKNNRYTFLLFPQLHRQV